MGTEKASAFPAVPSPDTIAGRLPLIFPEGTEHRGYVIRDMAVRTVFVMLYAVAIEGAERWVRPSQITDMGDSQATRTSAEERQAWMKLTLSSAKKRPADAWYAANSREPIRDETIRLGFIPAGAIAERSGLPTTSALPRYALEQEFAALFNEQLSETEAMRQIDAWQKKHLSKSALTRIALLRRNATQSRESVRVKLPNGDARTLAPGPSSVIAKAVIEEFASRFLKQPALLWLSESGNKVAAQDHALASSLGIRIDPSKNLPDLILADLGHESADVLILFVEVVATDGPVNRPRREAMRQIAVEAGFAADQVAYLSAFEDRSSPAYKKLASELAWGSFVWFAAEPQNLIVLHEGSEKSISELR